MAKSDLSTFFSADHHCNRREINKGIISAVTREHSVAVRAMFRAWQPSTFSHRAFKVLAMSKPEPLTRGQVTPNVTSVRKGLEALTWGRWQPPSKPDVSQGAGQIVIPPMIQGEVKR